MGTEHYSDNQCSRISGLSDSETISGKPTRDGHADYFRSDLYVKYLMMTGNRSERSLLIWGCVFFCLRVCLAVRYMIRQRIS